MKAGAVAGMSEHEYFVRKCAGLGIEEVKKYESLLDNPVAVEPT